jgi:hypothetical protein
MDTNPGPKYNYDVKIEFVLKSPGEKVYAKAIMVKTMKAIQSTIRKGEFVTFHDVRETKPVHTELRGIAAEEVADKFCFEVGGPGRSIAFFGIIVQSNLSFQVLKKRTFDEFKKTNTFMRLHTGGFEYGVNWSTLGFILEEHPVFTDVNTLRNTLMNKIATAWSNDSEIFTADKKADIAHTIKPNSDTPFTPFDIPMNITTSNVSARNDQGEVLKTNAVVVTIPHKFYHIGNFLMDHLTIVRNSVTHFIPNGFKREDPDGYYELADQHRIWLDKHRNIPILNVETLEQYTQEKNSNQVSLKILLLGVPGIERCNYDHTNKRVNVSVTANNFSKVSKAISITLATAGLPSQPTVKQNYNPTGSLGSKKTGTSKYLDTVSKYKKARSPTSSIGTSAGNQSHASARSTRTWNTNKIPTEIDFSEDNFPTIPQTTESPITIASERLIPPTAPVTTHYRDAVMEPTKLQGSTTRGYVSSFKPVPRQVVASPYTNDQQTESSITFQSAISQALAEAREDHMKMIVLQQDAHRKEIETLTLTFQNQMKALETNLYRTTQQPERMEFLEDKIEKTSNQMDARLDKIINLLLLNQEGNPTGPSPFRKKIRHEPPNDANMETDHFDQLSTPGGVQTRANSPDQESEFETMTLERKSPSTTEIPIDETMHDTIRAAPDTSSPKSTHSNKLPPLPDSPNPPDDSWLKRKTNASIAFTEKAKTLLNPYRTAQETLKLHKKTNRIGLFNAPNTTPMNVQLITLSSSRSDIASRGRED